MTWARLDDRTSNSPSWVSIPDAALAAVAVDHFGARPHELVEKARHLARNAKMVHLTSLMWSVPALSDGRLSPAAADQICAIGSLTAEEFYAAADVLVTAGAWKKIRPTTKEPLGAYQMILGWAPGEQPTRQEDEDRRKRQRLRDALREGARDYPKKVTALERAGGRCEYCGEKLGAEGGEIDHVDPNLFSNDVENLAVACKSCNKKKGHHRLADVGMAFTPGATRRRLHTDSTRGPHVDPCVDTVSARVGSGRVGSGKGRAGSGKGRARSGRAGSGAGPPSAGTADAPPSSTSASDTPTTSVRTHLEGDQP